MTLAAKVDLAIREVCPIHGVSIGHESDKATWRISFKAEATAQQRTAAQSVVGAFDNSAVVLTSNRQARLDELEQLITDGAAQDEINGAILEVLQA